jgi:heat-inducible transcriptional repressor
MLTPRQELILCKVVEGYLQSGQPVASKTIAADPGLDCGPSTVRNELALLEEHDLLAHPHTSAGRVPTDAGHRYVVDKLLGSGRGLQPANSLSLSLTRREVEEAMRVTSAAISRVTNLLAVVSAPSLNTATIRHVEVLELQPQVVMVVVITSTGGVSKRIFTFDSPVDPGLAEWAASYLNERLVGLGLGARMLHARLHDPSLPGTERDFLEVLAPAFGKLADTAEQTLYVDGAARLVDEHRWEDLSELNALLDMLERRVTLLGVLREVLSSRDVFVRIGRENEAPALRSLAVVAASYGLPQRSLGAVSVIGPMRMDYPRAIASVRSAAQALSRFVEDVYEDA